MGFLALVKDMKPPGCVVEQRAVEVLHESPKNLLAVLCNIHWGDHESKYVTYCIKAEQFQPITTDLQA